ncbi:MAG: hypothetical protein LBT66_00855 [Methanobrevibacter sp.]|nr:hypothetical protein [Candidatus Methanovirga meridionalis]
MLFKIIFKAKKIISFSVLKLCKTVFAFDETFRALFCKYIHEKYLFGLYK